MKKNNIVEHRSTKGHAALFVDGKAVEVNLRSLGCPEWLIKSTAEARAAKSPPQVVAADDAEALREKLNSISLF